MVLDGSIALTSPAPDHGAVTGYQVLFRRPRESEETFIVYVFDMGNTATPYTDTGTNLHTRHGYRVKAKNAHALSDVSNFAWIDTWLLSGNTASATMCHAHGPHNSTLKNAALRHGRCTMRGCYSRFTAGLTVARDKPRPWRRDAG